jgi:TetR/AcrR family transcriptional regulator, ethionamide resistance regulator
MSATDPLPHLDEETSRRRAGRSKGDQREDQILAVVRRLLTEKSMATITVDDITTAAGISRTAFYFYFPTKQAVLARLMEEVSDDFAQTHVWLATDGPSPETLREELAGAAALWQANGAILACTLNSAYVDAYPPLSDFVERVKARFAAGLEAKIARDQVSGAAPDTIGPATLAWMVDILRNTRLAHLRDADPDALEAGLAELAEAITRLIYARS